MELGTVTFWNPRGPRYSDDPTQVVGTIGLAWLPSPFVRLSVENSWKDPKSGEYKRVDTCELSRIGEVRTDFANVRISAKGQTYLQIRNLQIPWDIACELGEQARAKIKRMLAAREIAGQPEPAMTADDYENARMVTGSPQPGSHATRPTPDRD